MTLTLRNPHSVLAILSTRHQDIFEIRVPPGKPSDAWREIVNQAHARGIPVRTDLATTDLISRRRDQKTERQSIATALVREKEGLSLAELWSAEAPAPGQLWLALDCLQDPHNVGAIFRSAAFFGVRGIVLTKDRSAPMTGTVYDVASGGVEAMPFVQIPNLAAALKTAKEAGLWLLGSSEHATQDVAAIPRDRPWLLIIGNEEQGLRRLTLELCDETCSIPARGPVGSLNASVAAGVMISTLVR